MKKLLIIIGLLFLPLTVLATDFPGFPMGFYGNITFNGAPASIGSEVIARYGNNEAGRIKITEAGKYGSSSTLGAKLLVTTGNGAINFYFLNNGAEYLVGSYSTGFVSNQITEFGLDYKNSGSSTSSSGSSGGGGSRRRHLKVQSPTPPLTEEIPHGEEEEPISSQSKEEKQVTKEKDKEQKIAIFPQKPKLNKLAKPQFIDISRHWGKPYIIKIIKQELMRGFGNNFAPNQAATRAELSKMLTKYLFTTNQIKNCYKNNLNKIKYFTDIQQNAWYADFACMVIINKIINGTKQNTFSPNQPLTRAETITMITRAQKIDNKYAGIILGPRFHDANSNDWFYTPLVAAVMEQYINSPSKQLNFNPHKHITRAELAKIFSLAFDL